MAEQLQLPLAGLAAVSVDGLLECYRSSMKAANRSPKTVDWTIPIVQRFFSYLQTAGLGKPVNEIGPADLKSFILDLQNAPRWPGKPGISDEKRGKLSPHSIQALVRAIKAFWSWMLRSFGF